jgi:hypothetical protein
MGGRAVTNHERLPLSQRLAAVHIDGDPRNNDPDNIRFVPLTENLHRPGAPAMDPDLFDAKYRRVNPPPGVDLPRPPLSISAAIETCVWLTVSGLFLWYLAATGGHTWWDYFWRGTVVACLYGCVRQAARRITADRRHARATAWRIYDYTHEVER